MASCSITNRLDKTSKEWKFAESELGNDDALKLYIALGYSFPNMNQLKQLTSFYKLASKGGKKVKIKEGVSELFESNPELASAGTESQYSQYLDTIGITNVAYHHSESDLENFRTFPEGYFPQALKKKGTHYKKADDVVFFVKKPLTEEFMSQRKFKSAWGLKVPNMLQFNAGEKINDGIHPGIDEGVKAAIDGNYDAVDFGRIRDNKTWSEVIAITNPNNAVKLGSKQDIERFRKFVNSKKLQDARDIYAEGINNIPTISREVIQAKIKELTGIFGKNGLKVNVREFTKEELEKDNENAFVYPEEDGTYTIALRSFNEIASDKLPHEFAHIFINLLGHGHPKVQAAIKQIKSTYPGLYMLIQDQYSKGLDNPSVEKIEKELLVTVMGMKAIPFMEKNKLSSKLVYYIKSIYYEIAKLFGANVDVAEQLVQDMFYSNYRESLYADDWEREHSLKFDIIDEVEKINSSNNIRLTPDQSKYTDSKGTLYERLTEFVQTNFSHKYKDKKLTPAEASAQAIFDSKRKGLNETITYDDGKEYTYDQLVTKRRVDFETGRALGSIIHLKLEIAALKALGKDTRSLEQEIVKLAAGKPGIQEAIDPDTLFWANEKAKEVYDELGFDVFDDRKLLNERDQLFPELIVSNKDMNIATKIDGLIRHLDGDVSIVDYKTGTKFYDDANIPTLMDYVGDSDINDSKVNKAKLEIMLRAVMLKAVNPELKFKNLTVAHVSRDNPMTTAHVEIAQFLPMIERWLKATNPTLHEQYKAKGLFDPKLYGGKSQDLINADEIQGLNKADAIKLLQFKIEELIIKQKGKSVSAWPDWARDEHVRLTKLLLELNKDNGVRLEDESQDISWFKRWLGNQAGIDNKIVQTFFKYLNDAKTAARNIMYDFGKKHDLLFNAVLEEYYSANPTKRLLNKGFAGGIEYHNEDGTGLFDFMWEYKDKQNAAGYYAATYTENDVRSGRITQAQYNYYKFYRDTLNKYYNGVIGKTKAEYGKSQVTTGDLISKPSLISDDFMPRIPKQFEELTEGKDLLNSAKTLADNFIKNQADNWIEDNFYSKGILPGIPVKYLENNHIVGTQNHSFNAHLALNQFVYNLEMKDKLDPVYAIGQGVVTMLKLKQDVQGNPVFDKLAGFMEDRLKLDILEEKVKLKLTKKPIKIGNYTISEDKVVRNLRSWVSSASMWLKPIAGTANAVLIMMINHKEAIKGSLAVRLFGVPEESVSYTVSDLEWAQAEWAKLISDKMLGKEHDNKTHNLLKKLKYLPDDFDYKFTKDELLSSKNKALDSKYLYAFHGIGEEYGSITVMLAQLRHSKLKDGTTIYENYDNQANWTGPVRGVLSDGTEVTDLTSDEIIKLKRVSQRLHGSYRSDEKVALELHAFGTWALQFKKYLPSILENIGQSKYSDRTLGFYKIVGQDTQGRDILEWESMINEGRARVLFKLLLTVTHIKENPDYNWENLSDEQKQHVIEMGVTLMMYLSVLGIYFGAFPDDDDKNSMLGKRVSRLAEDITQGYKPSDILRSIQTQTVVLPKMFETQEALMDFFWDGVYEGKRTKEGNIKGASTLKKNLPFLSSIRDIERWTENTNLR